MAVADRLVLTKTDLADADTASALSARLRRLNPSAPLSRAAEAPLDAEALLSHDLFATAGTQRSRASLVRREWPRARRAVPTIATGTTRPSMPSRLIFDGPLDWTLFGLWLTMLLNRHGDKVLRVKGILNVAGSPAPVAVHGVQHLVHPPDPYDRLARCRSPFAAGLHRRRFGSRSDRTLAAGVPAARLERSVAGGRLKVLKSLPGRCRSGPPGC